MSDGATPTCISMRSYICPIQIVNRRFFAVVIIVLLRDENMHSWINAIILGFHALTAFAATEFVVFVECTEWKLLLPDQ